MKVSVWGEGRVGEACHREGTLHDLDAVFLVEVFRLLGEGLQAPRGVEKCCAASGDDALLDCLRTQHGRGEVKEGKAWESQGV